MTYPSHYRTAVFLSALFFNYSSTIFVFLLLILYIFFFFFNDTATTEIYTLSLHDALPIFHGVRPGRPRPEINKPLDMSQSFLAGKSLPNLRSRRRRRLGAKSRQDEDKGERNESELMQSLDKIRRIVAHTVQLTTRHEQCAMPRSVSQNCLRYLPEGVYEIPRLFWCASPFVKGRG